VHDHRAREPQLASGPGELACAHDGRGVQHGAHRCGRDQSVALSATAGPRADRSPALTKQTVVRVDGVGDAPMNRRARSAPHSPTDDHDVDSCKEELV
jgi:hypothetical protein